MRYEFQCTACGAEYEQEMTVSERSEAVLACPECGSDRVEQVFRAVHINTRKASCDNGGGCGCGGCCGHC